MTLEADFLDLALDSDHDLVDGFPLISGLAGTAQLCKIALLLVLGEWFLNQDRGMPWLPTDEQAGILGSKYDPALVRQLAISTLLRVVNVTDVTGVVVSLSADRRLSVRAQVVTRFGVTTVDASTGGSGD